MKYSVGPPSTYKFRKYMTNKSRYDIERNPFPCPWQGYFDGGLREGVGSGGAVLLDGEGNFVHASCITLPPSTSVTTNNEAEYAGLTLLLQLVHRYYQLPLFTTGLEIYGDSMLVVKQVTGEWRVREERLRPLYRNVLEMLEQFVPYRVLWIPRERNRFADIMASMPFVCSKHWVVKREKRERKGR